MIEQLMSSVMMNPEVAGVGIAVGFILAKVMALRKRRGMGGMGGGF